MSKSVNMTARISNWKLVYGLIDSFQISIDDNSFVVDHTVNFHDFDLEFESRKGLVSNIGFF